MEELIAQLSTIAKGMWRFRWHSLLVAWLVGVVAAIVVLRIPDRYEATARVYVDTQSILKPLMSGLAVQPNVDQQVAMLSRTLISRPNVEKLIRMADLDLAAESKAQQEGLISELMSTLEIKNVGRDNLYSLSFRDSNPARAQRIIQSLVSIFVESSLGATRKDTATAKLFLSEQIKAYETKLGDAEARLKEFRLKNLRLDSAEGKDTASRIAGITDQLDQARLALREAENARDAAKAQIASEKADSANISTSQSLLQESSLTVATPETNSRIEAQKRNLDGLLQRFTEQHPDIIATRQLIKELEELKRKQVAELRRAAMALPPTAANNNSNLAYQELSKIFAMSEVQVAGLRARVAEYSARYDRARESLKTAPQLEAEASQLNRDYAIQKKNYEDLVSRRESAVMSEDLGVASGVADFRLIDPPRASNKPVAPNRLVLMAIAMAIAVGSGLACAVVCAQLRPVFYTAGDLRGLFDLPVLGVVSRVVTPDDKRHAKVDMVRFAAGSGGLIIVFAIALVILSVVAARQAG
ncbi:MAG: chain length-determining protein [Ramlibacter sp.]|nr:chain length-determining protein [Ramlibacter sp.]